MSFTFHVPKEFNQINKIKLLPVYFNIEVDFFNRNSKSFKINGKDRELTVKYITDNYKEIIIVNRNNVDNLRTYYHFNESNSFSCFTPGQIAKIYEFPPIPQDRRCIAIIEPEGSSFLQSDLEKYWNKLGLFGKSKPIVLFSPTTNHFNTKDNNITFDIEIIGGINPNSIIYVYFAPRTNEGLYNTISKAVYNEGYKPSVISISWGVPEKKWEKETLNSFNELFENATNRGINICCSSGDSGITDGLSSWIFNVDFPASSPFVTTCGGTTLVCPNDDYDEDTIEKYCGKVDGEIGESAGGGYSSFFSQPDYQKGIVNNCMRGIPDVCGNADIQTGWKLLINGEDKIVGGTSVVAPMFAAYLSLLGTKKFINPIIYANGSSFHDIIEGNNENYSAAIGWDPATGLGSINGSQLNELL